MLFTIPQFVFAFYCAFSGQSVFEDWYISLYNLIFTSIPLVIRAIFEQDVNYIIKKSTSSSSAPISSQNSDISFQQLKTSDPVILRQEQYLPPGFKINKFLYRLFPKMYFIGQQNCIFNYQNYALWIF
jgi:magnesium-transporting ATPase (P-type)